MTDYKNAVLLNKGTGTYPGVCFGLDKKAVVKQVVENVWGTHGAGYYMNVQNSKIGFNSNGAVEGTRIWSVGTAP